MSARLCSKCKTRPKRVYGNGRTYSYCAECARQKRQESAVKWPSEKQLHRMADQYRPKEVEVGTETADPQARHQQRKKEFD